MTLKWRQSDRPTNKGQIVTTEIIKQVMFTLHVNTLSSRENLLEMNNF